ncbi:MAG: polyphosphate kinase [Gammaproteobacteria bacterium SG8_30]|nr:MAG: polyphosphate kinase [Gammaproteobacteria bacterium SG8_30]
MEALDLKSPELYQNRELSLLEFNQRVLEQAKDHRLPLLERVRFLAISSSNLDEFFEIRVAGLKQRVELGASRPGPDGLTPQQQLTRIAERARALVEEQYRVLNEVLRPALDGEGLGLAGGDNTPKGVQRWMREYFEREVEPVLTPLALDPARPFPRIQNKSLNFIVRLSGTDAFGRNTSLAIVQVPRSLPRVIPVGGTRSVDGPAMALLSRVIQTNIDRLFAGVEVLGCWQFRVTRNSDLYVDDEEVDDLLRAVEGELAHRRYGAAVRLETAHDCPEDLVSFLRQHFAVEAEDVYQVNGPVNLNRLMGLYGLVERPDLKFPAFTPGVPARLKQQADMFAAIRQRDVLLHHPYQSFQPVTDFVRQAATDPHVLAIKMTLYRAGADSLIVDGLVEAARHGKDVTVIVELRARFDEAANIELATRLQEAGVHVMYGVVGYKTHAKLIMVVRREDARLKRYCHVGTGNYHIQTARAYTDYGLFTADDSIGEDLHDLFLQLTSLTQAPALRKLLQSPFTLHAALIARIEREMEHARQGRPARVVAKMNSLIEPEMVRTLYRASQAGVRCELVVRGICALKPGIPGVSENITVRSIVGRFLEHSRVFYFANGGDEELFCASADWMERNFFRRIEVCFPIESRKHRERILADLEACLADNVNAWLLGPDGRYERVDAGTGERFSVQEALLEKYAE